MTFFASLQFKKLNSEGFSAGILSKSISFNSSKIPKVKQLSSEVPLRPKHWMERSSSITKQVGPMSTLNMSSSFNKSNFCDPAHMVKTHIKPNSDTGVLNPPSRQNVKNNRGTRGPCLRVSVKHYDTVSAIKGRSMDSPTVSSDLGDKALASTVPELDYIWQYEYSSLLFSCT